MEDQKADVVIHTLASCPYCNRAKQFLRDNGVKFKEVKIETHPDVVRKMKQEHNWNTLPLILINGQLIGGYDDMMRLHKENKLIPKLQSIIAGLGDPEISS
jgi:glutaredoxin